jgi:iron complex outermembrane receptor protein
VAVRNYVSPDNITNATSDLAQFQGNINAKLFDLPGGPVQVAVGGSIHYEAVDAPSANSDAAGPTQRYFTLNAFGTKGSRWVEAAYYELAVPVWKQLELSTAGRFDNYSSGQNNFSPKFGVKIKPVKMLMLRGTYSKGFRIPSFGEANALPTTGYVTNSSANFTDAFLKQYGCSKATYSSCPTYITTSSYGQTSLASPNLQPEKSSSLNLGLVFEPVRNFSITVDYYAIEKTGVITQPSNNPALQAYYSGQPIPAGYTVIPGAPDSSGNFPNATPVVGFVQAQLINANTQRVQGWDFSMDFRHKFGSSVRFSSHLEASYIAKLYTVFADGSWERYDGTLGNYNLTAGSGTPKWHGSWMNTFEFGEHYKVTGTVNYFSGYNLSAMDQGGTYMDNSLNPGYSPTGNNVPGYTTYDITGTIKVNDNFSIYGTMLNLTNKMPPIDVVTYGAHGYNPVQAGNGILGRYFKVGTKFNF